MEYHGKLEMTSMPQHTVLLPQQVFFEACTDVIGYGTVVTMNIQHSSLQLISH